MRPGTLERSRGRWSLGPSGRRCLSRLPWLRFLHRVLILGVFWEKRAGGWVFLVLFISQGVLEELLPHVVASHLVLPALAVADVSAAAIGAGVFLEPLEIFFLGGCW